MWEPIVKEGKLYGLSLNPLGKEAFLPGHLYPQSIQWHKEHLAKWELAESQRRLVEVDEKEILKLCDFESAKETDKGITATYTWKKCTFTADESEGKLINLKIHI